MNEDSEDSDDSNEGQETNLTEEILQNQGRFYIMMCLLRKMLKGKIDGLKKLIQFQKVTQSLLNSDLNYFYSLVNDPANIGADNSFKRVLEIFLKSIPLIVYHCLDKH